MTFDYRDSDGIVYRETAPLTHTEQLRRGLTAHSGPEGVYLILGLTKDGWVPCGPMEGTFNEAIEIVQINADAASHQFSDFRAEKRLIGI